MATVTLMLKRNKVNSKGEMPLYIRIIKGRKAKFISLGIKVPPDMWNEKRLRVKSPYPNCGRVNALIAKRIADAEGMAVDIETKHNSVSSKKIKEAIIGKAPVSLINFMEGHLADLLTKGKMGTHDKVNATLLKLKAYVKREDLTFEDFDLAFLKKYERYLREVLDNAPNTIPHTKSSGIFSTVGVPNTVAGVVPTCGPLVTTSVSSWPGLSGGG